MEVLLVLATICVTGCFGAALDTNSLYPGNRIVGGEETTIEEHPYQAAVEYGSQFRCGGSILNENTILTAAHCTFGLSPFNFYVRVGSSNQLRGGQRVKVSEVREHANYNNRSQIHDIGILKLEVPLLLNNFATPIELISAERDLSAGTSVVVSGWGLTAEEGSSSSVLRHVQVQIIDRVTCRFQYSLINYVTEDMICAAVPNGGKDACQGDSGGPLVVDGNILVGIVSWGWGCANANYPGVYTYVRNYLSWIAENSA